MPRFTPPALLCALTLILGLHMTDLFGSFDVDANGVRPAVTTSFTNYDALEPKGRRKAAPAHTERVDTTLNTPKRTRLSANTDDIAKNFALAQFFIRKHLDYVAQFDFHADTGDEGLDVELEDIMKEEARPNRCDAGGRATREKMFRLAEMRRTIDGDVGLLLLANGRMQGIESELIRDPTDETPKRPKRRGHDGWTNGVKINGAGRALQYALHARGPGGRGFQFDRAVTARRFIHYGYFDHYASEQTRGVSPIVAALNPLRDVYESFDYALMRAKVSQLFALAIYREADEAAGDVTGGGDTDEDENKSGYKVDFGRGPVVLDLDPGDKAQFLESQQPSQNMQEFTELIIKVAMTSLDLPFSFYDSAKGTWHGNRAGWFHYERSAWDKRNDQIEMRRRYTVWKLRQLILSGRLRLPRGRTIANTPWEWVPRGMPWWDPSKEVRGDVMAVGAGLDNPFRITKERGRGDFKKNVDKIAEAIAYAERKGNETIGRPIQLRFDPGPEPVEIATTNGN